MRVSRLIWQYGGIALGLAILTLLMGALSLGKGTYLLFHSLMELASIVVGVAIFSIGWHTRRVAGNSFWLVVATGALFVGLIDLLHTLAFYGMKVFPWDNKNLPTQFWVAARYLESLTFLGGAFVLAQRRHVEGWRLFCLYLGVTAALVITILPLGVFPFGLFPVALRVPGGLTPFKIISEIAVAGVFVLAGVLIWRQRAALDAQVATWLVVAFAVKVASEIAFTLYGTKVDGAFNALGHIFKGYATIALYLALVQAVVTKPFQTHFRELHQTQEWLRVTLASIGDAVIACDTEGRITFINPVAATLTGWTASEALGAPIRTVFHIVNELTGEPGDDIVGRVLREGHVVELANHSALITRDGRDIPIEDSAAPITDTAGHVSGVVLVFHDVTEKRRAELALRESELKFSTLYAKAPISIALSRLPEGRFVDVNEAFEQLFGFTRDEVLGKTAVELDIFPDFATQARLASVLQQSGSAHNLELAFCTTAGEQRMTSNNLDVLVLGGERYLLAITLDITARKHSEATRDRALAELDSILTTLADPLLVVRADGKVVRANLAAVAACGLDPTTLDPADVERLLRVTDVDGHLLGAGARPSSRALQGAVVIGERCQLTNAVGRVTTILASAVPLRHEETIAGCVLSWRDITEREQLLAAVAHRAAELDATITAMRDGVVLCDAQGTIVRLNPAAERILGYPPEVRELPLDERVPAVRVEYPDGRRVPLDETPVARALRGGQVHGMVVKYFRDDELLGWFSNSAAPVRTADGQITGVVATFTDVTALRELQEQQQTLLHLVSHDLRAPLTIIKGYAAILQECLAQHPDPLALSSVSAVLRGVNRMDVMIEDLVEVTRLEGGRLELKRQPVPLADYLADLALRAGQALEMSRVQLDIPSSSPPITAAWSASCSTCCPTR